MATAKTSSSTSMRTATVTPAASKAAKSTAASKGPAKAAETRVAPKPVPKATRSLAASFATLGDPRNLQVLGSLSNGLPATTAGFALSYGMEAETATSAIAALKKQGWVEGSRVEGSRNYTYRITEAGSAAWGKAQSFNAV